MLLGKPGRKDALGQPAGSGWAPAAPSPPHGAPGSRSASRSRPPLTALVNCQADCLPGQGPGKQRPHEGPFVTQHTAALVPDAVRFDELRVDTEQGAVLLIGSEA